LRGSGRRTEQQRRQYDQRDTLCLHGDILPSKRTSVPIASAKDRIGRFGVGHRAHPEFGKPQ
jgi:hypothetical protein